MKEWEAKFWTGNCFVGFIDYKLKLQAIINNLNMDRTCYTELLTQLYKMSGKAVARHKFCEAHYQLSIKTLCYYKTAAAVAVKCCSETSFPATVFTFRVTFLRCLWPISPTFPLFFSKINTTVICEIMFKDHKCYFIFCLYGIIHTFCIGDCDWYPWMEMQVRAWGCVIWAGLSWPCFDFVDETFFIQNSFDLAGLKRWGEASRCFYLFFFTLFQQ